MTKAKETVYCKALFKYKGFPIPPLKPVLLFDQDEIIQLTDYDDDEWWRGVKLRFRGAEADMAMYKEEGYFPRNYVKNVDVRSDLNFYSWYLSGDNKELAIKILYRLMPYNSLKPVFLVRSRSKRDAGYAISFTHNNKIFHIKVELWQNILLFWTYLFATKYVG